MSHGQKKTKQNLETRTAEMEQQSLRAVTIMVEISQMVDLHRWFYIANALSILLPIPGVITLPWYTIVFFAVIIIIVFTSSSLSSIIVWAQKHLLGELKMCGRQDNSNQWLAFIHDPVVMGGYLRRSDVSDMPKSKTFLLHCLLFRIAA